MKAAVVVGPGLIEIQNVPDPVCNPEDIIIQVQACGICGSDVRILRHGNPRVKLPAIIGHETAGVIVEKGAKVSAFAIGDRVAIGADIPCCQCHYCLTGHSNNCRTNLAIGYQFPGGFAQYLKIDRRVWDAGPFQVINRETSLEEAALAEPLACAINGLEILPKTHQTTRSILVIGGGVLGGMFVKLAPLFGFSRTFLTDIDQTKLNWLKERGFAAEHFWLNDTTLPGRVLEATEGRGADAVMVACADIHAQHLALELVAPRGTVNLFAGLPANTADLSFPSNLLHYHEIALTGSHGSTPRQHARAVKLICSGRVRLRPLITHIFPLDKIKDAFATMDSPTRFKVLITPGS